MEQELSVTTREEDTYYVRPHTPDDNMQIAL